MKTINVFLASSEELRQERNEFSDLILQLNDLFERREIRLKLVRWEHLDASMGVERKQTEYNEKLKACEMCLTLYWTKMGEYTNEELNAAYERMKRGETPHKIYVYFKDAPDAETSEELRKFKALFTTQYGHFFCRFENVDTMRLNFLLQFELYQNACSADPLLEIGNQAVTVGGCKLVDLNKVPFAAGNEEYVRLRDTISQLDGEIAKLRMRLEKYPDDEEFAAELQQKLNDRNAKADAFGKYQTTLFDTALKMTRLLGEQISDRQARAIEAFNAGRVSEANIILAEAERDADRNLAELQQAVELTEQKRLNVVLSIDELRQKADIELCDPHYPIEERIARTHATYQKAVELACNPHAGYDPEQHGSLLSDYACFLEKYAFYAQALTCSKQALAIWEKTLGKEHPDTATSYNNIGNVYNAQGDYAQALTCHQQALAIREKVLGEEHPDTAVSYNNIGNVYSAQGDYALALTNYRQALAIQEKTLGKEHPDTANSYNNIGNVYSDQGNYAQALTYHQRALAIRKKVLGQEHPDTADSYNNIGCVYYAQGDYAQALTYYRQALAIDEKTFGKEHPNTAKSYHNIGYVYDEQGDYPKAVDYLSKAAMIYLKLAKGSDAFAEKLNKTLRKLVAVIKNNQ